MKEWIDRMKSRVQLRTAVSLALGAFGLLLFVIALQANFQQSILYTQVTRVSEDGQQEMMIFRDYRNAAAEEQMADYDHCMLRNQLFGDGTGEECEAVFESYECIKASRSVEEVEAC